MYSKIKIYSLFLLLLLGIGQSNAQQGCWLDDLTTILQSPGNSEFKSFIGAHDNGFMKFRALHEAVGSRTARTNTNVLRFYAGVADEVKDKITTFTHRQIVDFTNDFGNFSATQLRNLDNNFSEAWEIIYEAGFNASKRTNPRELRLVGEHLDEIRNFRGGYHSWKISRRESWINELQNSFGQRDFVPQGLSRSDVPDVVLDNMNRTSNINDPIVLERIMNELIQSGSRIPVRKSFQRGDELYKIVPKGSRVTEYTPFWFTKSEWDSVKDLPDLEQRLGLPLGSHAAEYDLYRITANRNGDYFESIIASTIQGGYRTTGGAKQTLVLDRGHWNQPIKIETFLP